MRGNCIAEEKSHCINKTDGDIIHLHIKQSKYIRLSCLNQRTMYYGEMKTKNVVVNQPVCIADADANLSVLYSTQTTTTKNKNNEVY